VRPVAAKTSLKEIQLYLGVPDMLQKSKESGQNSRMIWNDIYIYIYPLEQLIELNE
jgi:hypothetical protein